VATRPPARIDWSSDWLPVTSLAGAAGCMCVVPLDTFAVPDAAAAKYVECAAVLQTAHELATSPDPVWVLRFPKQYKMAKILHPFKA
jgi:hypothetical protein